jgi:hypothetical protein
MTDGTQFKYDVALSLLYPQLAIAKRLRTALRPLRVFLFTDRQNEIAGGDLLEVFNQTFRYDARFAVILHSAGWGTTRYTGVESRAIQARAADTNHRSYLFVKLDDSPLPKWVPHDHAYLDFRAYRLPGVVGAVRHRVQLEWGVLPSESALERGLRLANDARTKADREAYLRTQAALDAANNEVQTLFATLTRLISQYAQETALTGYRSGNDREHWVFTAHRWATAVDWKTKYTDSPLEAGLYVREYAGPLLVPGDNARLVREPELLHEIRREFAIVDEGTAWRIPGTDSDLSTAQVADDVAGRIFERLVSPPPNPPQRGPQFRGPGWVRGY